jgi:anti-sigma factor RsiW
MIHEEQRVLISEYVDDELDVSAEKDLFDHLTQCEQCREFLRHSIRLKSDMAADPVRIWSSAEFQQEGATKTRGSYASDRKPVGSYFRSSARRSPISTLVLLMLVIVIVGFLFSVDFRVQNGPGVSNRESVQLR